MAHLPASPHTHSYLVPLVNLILPALLGDSFHSHLFVHCFHLTLPGSGRDGKKEGKEEGKEWMSAHPLLFIFPQCFQMPHYPTLGKPLLKFPSLPDPS